MVEWELDDFKKGWQRSEKLCKLFVGMILDFVPNYKQFRNFSWTFSHVALKLHRKTECNIFSNIPEVHSGYDSRNNHSWKLRRLVVVCALVLIYRAHYDTYFYFNICQCEEEWFHHITNVRISKDNGLFVVQMYYYCLLISFYWNHESILKRRSNIWWQQLRLLYENETVMSELMGECAP